MNRSSKAVTGFTALITTAIFFLTPLTLYSQGHAGHTVPPPAAPPSKNAGSQPQAAATPQPKAAAETVEEAPQIELSAEQMQRIGVKTVTVSAKPLQKVIRTVGRIETDERSQTTINAKVEGWIEKLYVDYTGRYVKKGEPLADIYSPELLATQQEFLNTLKWSGRQTGPKTQEGHDHKAANGLPDTTSDLQKMLAKDASAILAAARQRLRLWDISDEQIQQIEKTGKPVRTLTLYSPVSGNITQKMAVAGMRVMPGEKLFDVADLSRLWIIADIYEYELAAVRVGQPVSVTLSYFPGWQWSSRIDYIYPVIAAETRTAKVRLTLPNTDGQLKPQMFTNVEIRIGLGKRLSIPEAAVMDTGKGQVVYVDRGNGIFEPREIRTGLRAEGAVEVLRGLKAGDRVAAAANFLIDSEAQLKGVKPLSKP